MLNVKLSTIYYWQFLQSRIRHRYLSNISQNFNDKNSLKTKLDKNNLKSLS